MADYYNILRNAIEEMDAKTPAARDAVFARARAALQSQITGLEPPLSEDAVKAQWAAIDQAIARLSGELAVADSLARPAAGTSPEPETGTEAETATPDSLAAPKAEQGADALPPDEPSVAADAETVPDDAVTDGEESARPAPGGQEETIARDPVENEPDDAAGEAGDDNPDSLTHRQEMPPPMVQPVVAESADADADAEADLAESTETGRIEPVIAAPDADDESPPADEIQTGVLLEDDRTEPPVGSAESDAGLGPATPEDRMAGEEKPRRRGGLIAFAVLLLLVLAGALAALFNWAQSQKLVAETTGYRLPDLPDALAALMPGAEPEAERGASEVSQDDARRQDPAAPQDAAAPTAGGQAQVVPGSGSDGGVRSMQEPPALPAPQPEQQAAGQPGTAGGPANPGEGTPSVQQTETAQAAAQNDQATAEPPAAQAPQAGEAAQEQPAVADATSQTAEAPAPATPVAKDQERPAAQEPVTEPAMFAVEAAPDAGDDTRHAGRALWSVSGSGEQAVLSVVVTIPDIGSKFTMEMSRNADKSLPASHTLEFIHAPGEDDPDGRMMNVPGVLLRPEEDVQGQPLQGAGALIVPGQYLMGLKDTPAARRANISMLKQGKWMVIPVLMESKRRALMVFRKGETGTRALNAVLEAWGEDELPPETAAGPQGIPGQPGTPMPPGVPTLPQPQ